MSNLQGTTVPSNAFVEKVYINVDLSIEEVVLIIDSANLTYNFASKYTVVDGIEISNILGKTIIVNNEVVFKEADSMNTGAFVGWKEGFNGIIAVNKQNSYGTQNDALSSLFSITPFTQPQEGQVIVSKSKLTAIADNIRNQTGATGLITLDEMAKMKLGGGATITTKGGWQGTPVPNTGYVEKVYFNSELSIDEVDNLLSELAYIQTNLHDKPISPLLLTEKYEGLGALKFNDGYAIIYFNLDSMTQIPCYCSSPSVGTTVLGWLMEEDKKDLPQVFDSDVLSEFDGLQVGADNNKLSSLISTTPFVQDIEEVILEGEYDGSSIEVTENGSLDIKALIENKQIPLEVNVNVPTGITPSGTYEVTDNGEYDITQYAKVNVNVASSGGSEELPTDLSYMFYYNSKITSIDKFCIDWYKYTSEVTNIEKIFSYCLTLINIPQLNTSKVNNMNSAFRNCVALTNISLSDTSKVTNIEHAFRDCKALKNISRLNTSNIVSVHYMFTNCYLIEKIDISYYNTKKTIASSFWCAHCYSLKAVIIRGFGDYILDSSAFNNCYHLTGTVNATYNPDGLKDGYIYVPRNMVETLSSATNWSTYADQIRALEDYTVDGTTTGELDESKI